MSHVLTDICSILLLLIGLLLIFVILLQRGRGGGLAGAFGGAGGQSAFGTKAGDVFTRITIGIAIAWVTMAVLTGYAMTYDSGKTRFESKAADASVPPVDGAVLPGAPTKDNPFEAGSQPAAPAGKSGDSTTTPSKTTPAPSKSTATKDAPAAKGTATPPAKTDAPSPPPTK
jgi:preprotein translocase subunit SecG